MPTPSLTAHPRDGWAEIRAHDQVMRYRRCGAGCTVLVLGSSAEGDPLWPELVAALADGFRLIAPEVPPAGADVSAWLAAFLEGLGTASVGVVAAEPYCMAALELALLDGGQLRRVVLVPGGPPAVAGRDGLLATAGRGAPVPLLVVRRAVSAGEALPLVTGFLADEAAPA